MSVVERVILCGGAPSPPHVRRNKLLVLRLGDGEADVKLKITDITNRLGSDLPDVLVDLVEVASYIYCADQAVTRGAEGVITFGRKWRRRLLFHIPVRVPEVWSSEPVVAALRHTLTFLSDDDEYEFHFLKHQNPAPIQSYLDLRPEMQRIDEIDEVLLFSGGLDSLAGTVLEAVRDKHHVALVSHRANPKIHSKQKLLVNDLRALCPGKLFHVPVWVQKGEALDREYTQRTRTFLYAALAVVVARAFELRRIRFYENGVVSLNLPISEQVVGGRATRTTHPQVLNGFASLFRLLTEGTFDVENPFLWLTKGEVVNLIGDTGCADLIKHSVSCTHTREMTHMWTHCGRCSQCISRRFATLASKYVDHDPAEMYKLDLLVGEREKDVDLTLLESFIRIAADMKGMNEYQLLDRFGEVSRVLTHVHPLTPDQVAERIVRLHQKHSEEVNRVMQNALSRHSAEVLGQELPRTCAIILAFPDKYKNTIDKLGKPDKRPAPRSESRRRDYRFETPPGTKWSGILIRFLDGHTVTIAVDSKMERYTFAEMNMKDGRNGNPTEQWKLLELLAKNGGR
ncbi:MAG TPA: 7-cyano-7-deazaguanine synthase, partial [Nitrospira sp.]|nr:7-cyano-7-deazaguanine synthase [Nitrospira sp.]